MTELHNAKMFGGIGSLLTLVGGLIPNAGPIISIVGIVLVLLAVKKIADITEDETIFKNYLIQFVLSIIAIITVMAIMIAAFGAAGGFSWIRSLETADITNFETFWSYFGEIIGFCILSLIIAWILSVIGTMYLRRSYNSIAQQTEVDLFRKTGTIYFVGAITSILLIGFIILFIGRIIEIIAYFSLPDKLPSEQKQSQRRCPECGRIIPEDAIICPYCEKHY